MQRFSFWRIAICLACLCITTAVHAFPPPGAGKSGPPQTQGRSVTLPMQNFSKTPLTQGNMSRQIDLPKQGGTVKTPLVIDSAKKFDTKQGQATLPAIKPQLDPKFNAGRVATKPPQDFQTKKFDLAKIHVPYDAHRVTKLNAGHRFQGQKFILNQQAFHGSNYHLQFGQRHGSSWCYHGIHHNHWHHCIWVPSFACYHYYDPCVCCYYYYSVADTCYYPCQ